jgi:hypothetical protein
MKFLLIVRTCLMAALFILAAAQLLKSTESLLHISNLLSFGLMALSFHNLILILTGN